MTPSPRILAYTYEADYHCVPCTQKRHLQGGFRDNKWANLPGNDYHGVPHQAGDREGNLVHPVFSTDKKPGQHVICGTCRFHIEELA